MPRPANRPQNEPPEVFSARWLGWACRYVAEEFRGGWTDAADDRDGTGPVPVYHRHPRTERRPSLVAPVGLLVGAGVVAAGLFIYGLIDNTEGFFGNAVAEVAGLLLGVILSVLVIQTVLDQRQRAAWVRVQEQLHVAVCEQVLEIAQLVDSALAQAGQPGAGAGIGPDDIDEPIEKVVEGLEALQADLAAGTDLLADYVDDEELATSRRTYEDCRIALESIRDVLSPRALSVGADPPVASAFLAFESAERRWRQALRLIASGEATETQCWDAARKTLRAATQVVVALHATQ